MKLSASMLVSRYDEKLFRSLNSVFIQEPDSFKAYIDTVKLEPVVDEVKEAIIHYGGEPVEQKTYEQYSHHENVVHSVHRAILESENQWIVWNDDDDEILSDRHKIVEQYGMSDVGFIYGDLIYIRDDEIHIQRSKQIYDPSDIHLVLGSGQIYNREAFKEIHDMLDHGYWWDFKIFYWMMKAGYRAQYVPQIMSLQNFNHNIDRNRLRARQLGWKNTLNRLKNIDF